MNKTVLHKEINSLYPTHLLAHARDAQYWTRLDPTTLDHRAVNALCGDDLRLTLRWSAASVVTAVGWSGDGCAISRASATLLGDRLMGMSIDAALHLRDEDMLDMLGVSLPRSRRKCALLPLRALREGASAMGLDTKTTE